MQNSGNFDLLCRVSCIGPTAVVGIFFAINRCHMRRIFIKIWSPYPKLLAVLVDPVPQFFTCNASLVTIFAFYADDISRKPMAITAAETSTMV